MEALDTLILSRIQFAANISFHILFPTITIALGWVLFFFRVRFAQTGDDKWMASYRFWVKIFALSFAMGVVSGITMSFQFGTNWPGFMETVGNIAGPLLAYEVLTAFFLEAVFIGIMLFGFSRVPGWLHMLATGLVAFGTTVSAFWIIVLNSWMHTPQGFEMIDGVAFATDWWEIIFNPSMPYRFAHMWLASGLTVAFLSGRCVVVPLASGRSVPRCAHDAENRRGAGCTGDPGPDLPGRPPWSQHQGIPTRQGRGDGRALGNRHERAPAPVRNPR
jgi:cytochrome d ubiquinol oxidase subunit I